MARRLPFCVVVLVFLTLAAGCGSSGPQVVSVSGTVTRSGKPVNKLLVKFIPVSGRPSWGITDEDGHYVLNYDKDRAGAVIGKHKVWVKIQGTNPKEDDDLRNGTISLHPEMEAIREKYGSEKTSPLEVEVKENNQVIDLPLD